MEAAHAILSAWWRSRGDSPSVSKVADLAVQALERRYAVSLPGDFRSYLLHGAPGDHLYDDNDVLWWSAAQIKNIPDEYGAPINHPRIAAKAETYLFFADFMIWFGAWAICCDEGEDRGKVALIGGAPDRFVADSFTDFVKAYVADSRTVGWP